MFFKENNEIFVYQMHCTYIYVSSSISQNHWFDPASKKCTRSYVNLITQNMEGKDNKNLKHRILCALKICFLCPLHARIISFILPPFMYYIFICCPLYIFYFICSSSSSILFSCWSISTCSFFFLHVMHWGWRALMYVHVELSRVVIKL